MIKFLEGDAINAKIIQCIKEADEYLYLISPFIKLNEKVKAALNRLANNKPEVAIEIVFGKNDGAPDKSLSKEDLEFIKQLPNINLYYSKNLHAKIYCSEDCIIVGSMNLHEYSHAKNFEAALMIEERKGLAGLVQNSLNQAATTAWNEAMEFINDIIRNANLVYRKGPKYESFLFGFMEKFTGEEELEDNSVQFFESSKIKTGYCIRTGVPIPFNIKQPFSPDAYKSWLKYKNEDFKEKYCHFSGEASNGENSYKQPVIKKNWQKAQKLLS